MYLETNHIRVSRVALRDTVIFLAPLTASSATPPHHLSSSLQHTCTRQHADAPTRQHANAPTRSYANTKHQTPNTKHQICQYANAPTRQRRAEMLTRQHAQSQTMRRRASDASTHQCTNAPTVPTYPP